MDRLPAQSERYVQTVFELIEDGHDVLMAEVGRRLMRHSATVSEATARLARAGLVVRPSSRRVGLTTHGECVARSVVRRHRVIECLLHEVVGLDWTLIHGEALRWQHVLGERAEAKIDQLLGSPTTSPFGYPIPRVGAPTTGLMRAEQATVGPLVPLPQLVETGGSRRVTLRRVSERLQSDVQVMADLKRAGVRPGGRIVVQHMPGSGTLLVAHGERRPIILDQQTAADLRASP